MQRTEELLFVLVLIYQVLINGSELVFIVVFILLSPMGYVSAASQPSHRAVIYLPLPTLLGNLGRGDLLDIGTQQSLGYMQDVSSVTHLGGDYYVGQVSAGPTNQIQKHKVKQIAGSSMQRGLVLEGEAASPSLGSVAFVICHFSSTFSPLPMVTGTEGVVQIYPLNQIQVQIMSLAIFFKQMTLGKLSPRALFYFISCETVIIYLSFSLVDDCNCQTSK